MRRRGQARAAGRARRGRGAVPAPRAAEAGPRAVALRPPPPRPPRSPIAVAAAATATASAVERSVSSVRRQFFGLGLELGVADRRHALGDDRAAGQRRRRPPRRRRRSRRGAAPRRGTRATAAALAGAALRRAGCSAARAGSAARARCRGATGRSRSSACVNACATSWPMSRTPLLSGSSASRSGGSTSTASRARSTAATGRTRRRAIERRQIAPEAARGAAPPLRASASRLEAARQLRRQDLEQLGLEQQLHRALGRARAQQPVELLRHARLRALRDLRAVLHHAPVGLGLDGQIAARRELHRAQDADRILAEADVGIADGADDARLEIGHAVDVVDDLPGLEVVEQAVDREVAPAGVLLGRAEDVVAADQQVAALGLGALAAAFLFLDLARVGAERGRLDDLRSEEDVREAEAAADDAAVAEQAPDVVRASRWWRRRSPSACGPSSRSRTQPPTR